MKLAATKKVGANRVNSELEEWVSVVTEAYGWTLTSTKTVLAIQSLESRRLEGVLSTL